MIIKFKQRIQEAVSWKCTILLIREFCLDPLELSVTDAAKALGVTRKRLSALLNGRSKVSPEMALRLSKVFGRTPEGWLKLQVQFDLGKVRKKVDLSGLNYYRRPNNAD